MSDFALKLDTPNVIHVYQNRIASFSLKQEIYTPYTQLSIVATRDAPKCGSCTPPAEIMRR